MRKLGLGLGLAACVAVAGCSTTTSSDDMSLPDLSMGGDLASGPDMATSVLTGTKVVTGAAQPVGLTTDNYIVYFPGGAGVSAVKLDGTDGSVKIAAANQTLISGKVVFGWANGTDTIGELWAWKLGATAAVKLSDASLRGDSSTTPRTLDGAVASTDGTRVLYSSGATATTTDVYVADFAGTNAVKVLTAIPTTGDCELSAQFAGGKFIVGYCTSNAAADGGIAASKIVAIDAANPATVTDLFTNVRNFASVDTAGTKVAAVDINQQLKWVGIAGGTPVTVATGVVSGLLAVVNPAGTNLVWLNNSDNLMRLDISSAAQAPVQLQTGIKRILRISPDGAVAFLSKVADETDPMFPKYDVYLASLTTASAATSLVATPTGNIFGSAFSLDNSKAYYYSDCAAGSGTLHSRPVAGGADTVIAPNVWNEYAGPGNTLVYADNYRAATSYVDLKTVANTGGTATTIATNIRDDAQYRHIISKDGTKLIYSYTGKPTTAQGLYVYNVQ